MNAAVLSAPLVITSGEPAGIGPDLCVQLAVAPPNIPIAVIADKNLLLQRAAQLGIDLQVQDFVSQKTRSKGQHPSPFTFHLSRIFSPFTFHFSPCFLKKENLL